MRLLGILTTIALLGFIVIVRMAIRFGKFLRRLIEKEKVKERNLDRGNCIYGNSKACKRLKSVADIYSQSNYLRVKGNERRF